VSGSGRASGEQVVRWWLRALLGLVVLAVLVGTGAALVGCGGGSDGEESADEEATGEDEAAPRVTPAWMLSRHYAPYAAAEEKYAKAMRIAHFRAKPPPPTYTSAPQVTAPAESGAPAVAFRPLPPERPDYQGAHTLLLEVIREADPILGRLDLSGGIAGQEGRPDLELGRRIRDLIGRSLRARDRVGTRMQEEAALGALIALKQGREFRIRKYEVSTPKPCPTADLLKPGGPKVDIVGRVPVEIVEATIIPGAAPTETADLPPTAELIATVPAAIEATPEAQPVSPTAPPRREETEISEEPSGESFEEPETEEADFSLIEEPTPEELPTSEDIPEEPTEEAAPGERRPVTVGKIDSEGEGVACWFTFTSPGRNRTLVSIQVVFRDRNGEFVCHGNAVFKGEGFEPRWSNVLASAGTPVTAGSMAVRADTPTGFAAVGASPRATEAVRAHISIMTEDGATYTGKGGEGLITLP